MSEDAANASVTNGGSVPTDEEYAAAFPAAVEEEAVAQAAPKPVRWLTNRKRVEKYDLLFPFEYDGKEFWSVTIRRMTFDEVSAFMESVRQGADRARPPLYFDERADPIDDNVWGVLDADDQIELTRIGNDFLPAIFRLPTEAKADGSAPTTGDTSDSSSAT